MTTITTPTARLTGSDTLDPGHSAIGSSPATRVGDTVTVELDISTIKVPAIKVPAIRDR